MSGEVVQNLPNAIAKEIDLLEPIASHADIKIDTSQLNIHQLKELIREHLGMVNAVTVNVLSFGFKYGIPIDADYVFDVRILPNPHWEASLRVQTGKMGSGSVFAKHPEVETMSDDIYDFMARWLRNFCTTIATLLRLLLVALVVTPFGIYCRAVGKSFVRGAT